MMPRKLAVLLALAFLPASCANVPLGGNGMPVRSSTPAGRTGDAGWSQAENSSEAVLYARDGSPVRRSAGNSALTSGVETLAPRTVSDGGGSRPYLLELYQEAVSEKDQLNLEVTALNQELSRQDETYRGLETELHHLQQQFRALETERDGIQKQNFELAGRLTTAQIRRLESEKMLLEAIIEQRRLARENAQATASDDQEPRGFLNTNQNSPDGGGGR